METIDRYLRRHDWFARRRDLLAAGYRDAQIREALGEKRIFRVRQGWYSVPDAPADAILAVRTGGRLAGIAVLQSYGLRVPRRTVLDVAVPPNACRLRRPGDRRERLRGSDTVAVVWNDVPIGAHESPWRTSLSDALLHIIRTEGRDVAVACASAMRRFLRWTEAQVRAVFLRAPLRTRAWLPLVSELDEAHGETIVRLGFHDAGIEYTSQARHRGVGRFDFGVGPNSYVEVDGAQHDPEWTGEGESNWQKDFDRDIAVTIDGKRVLRFNYRYIYAHWDKCLAAVRRMMDDDIELQARRQVTPAVPRAVRAHAKGIARRAAEHRRDLARRRTEGEAVPSG